MSTSVNKRNKEKQRQEQRRDKQARQQQRREEQSKRAPAEPGVDPDIAGIVPGPQPIPPEDD